MPEQTPRRSRVRASPRRPPPRRRPRRGGAPAADGRRRGGRDRDRGPRRRLHRPVPGPGASAEAPLALAVRAAFTVAGTVPLVWAAARFLDRRPLAAFGLGRYPRGWAMPWPPWWRRCSPPRCSW
ncbi:hypothetical protein HFP72_01040 [Nocardiopsis sp. ARC36]